MLVRVEAAGIEPAAKLNKAPEGAQFWNVTHSRTHAICVPSSQPKIYGHSVAENRYRLGKAAACRRTSKSMDSSGGMPAADRVPNLWTTWTCELTQLAVGYDPHIIVSPAKALDPKSRSFTPRRAQVRTASELPQIPAPPTKKASVKLPPLHGWNSDRLAESTLTNAVRATLIVIPSLFPIRSDRYTKKPRSTRELDVVMIECDWKFPRKEGGTKMFIDHGICLRLSKSTFPIRSPNCGMQLTATIAASRSSSMH